MPDQSSHPLLRLGAPKVHQRKKQQPHFPAPPSRDPLQHATHLQAGFKQAQDHLKEAGKVAPGLATDVPYVRVRPAPGTFMGEQDLKSLGFIPIFRRGDSVIAAFAGDGGTRFSQQMKAYSTQRLKLGGAAKIESMGAWGFEERVTPRLKAALATWPVDEAHVVDLMLMPLEYGVANPQAATAIDRFARSHGGQVVDELKQSDLDLVRVRLKAQALSTLLEYRDDIAVADLPPRAHVTPPQLYELKLDDLPEVNTPPAGSPTICVVDSGIVEAHPLLAPAVVGERSRSFPPALGPPALGVLPNRSAGHGTQVAGIALYGDIADKFAQKRFEPDVVLVNARILNDQAEFPEDRIPSLKEVVEHAGPGCKVFNLSVGAEYSGPHLSPQAVELDGLTRERGVLFVVSAGNIEDSFFGRTLPAYPDYLLDGRFTVRAPAEAFNVLTVGGYAPEADLLQPHPSRHPVAPRRHPSPFNCTGGLKGVLKPELVELGGNKVFDKDTKNWALDPGARVPTTEPEFRRRLLGYIEGTSFAAPKVAHLAAQILAKHPDASPNLIRALLVHSARVPDGVHAKPAIVMRLCGFGIPSLDRALYCSPQRATLIHQGRIDVDAVHIFDIPVPEELSKSKGEKRITVTIAYDPPVSAVNRDRPTGIKLTWGLARGSVSIEDLEEAIVASSEGDGDEEDEETDDEGLEPVAPKKKSPFWKGKLPKQEQRSSTVQKNEFIWTRGLHGDTYRLALIAKAVRPAHANAQQSYSVVVSLEPTDPALNIYQHVRARLDAARPRVRTPAG